MDLYTRLKRNPEQFLAFTGMHLHTFEDLLPQFEHTFLHLEQDRKSKTVRSQSDRQRLIGGGNAFQNDLPNRLLMLLLYYRLYLRQEFLTLFFNAANKSLISRNITSMRPVFEAVLPTHERARQRLLNVAKAEGERRKKRIGSIEEFREAYPDKKKRHTRKQLITSTPVGIIVDQSPSVGGRTDDFQAFKDDHTERGILNELAEVRATSYGESGFQGMQKMGLRVEVRLQERGRRNHPLTRDQKKINALRSSLGVRVEHTTSRRKKCRIASEEYRNRYGDYDQMMNIVGG